MAPLLYYAVPATSVFPHIMLIAIHNRTSVQSFNSSRICAVFTPRHHISMIPPSHSTRKHADLMAWTKIPRTGNNRGWIILREAGSFYRIQQGLLLWSQRLPIRMTFRWRHGSQQSKLRLSGNDCQNPQRNNSWSAPLPLLKCTYMITYPFTSTLNHLLMPSDALGRCVCTFIQPPLSPPLLPHDHSLPLLSN